MMEIRTARTCEAAQEQALWLQVFGDPQTYIQCYYDTCYAPEDVHVLLEDGRIVSMLICLPVALCLPGGSTGRGAYIYALATAPAARGRGLAHRLLAFTHAHLRAQALDLAVTVPAMDSLFGFFQTAGFAPFFYTREQRFARADLPPATGRAEVCSAEAYHHHRQAFRFAQPSVVYPAAQILWQKRVSTLARADLYRIPLGTAAAFAAAEYADAQTLVLKELLAPAAQTAQALANLVGSLPAHTCVVRMPLCATAQPAPAERFGMVAWYNAALAQEARAHTAPGYLGLAFD